MFERIMEAGTAVYFLWGIGLLGLLLKMITNTYLKGMIKASENMATTKKKSLRIIRQKYENGRSLGINKGSGQAFVEKSVRALKLANVPLEGLRRSGKTLCSVIFMVTAGAFMYYDVSWRGSPEMVSFLVNAIMVCAFLMCIENIFLINNKVEILKANIRDYLENLTPVRANTPRKQGPEISGLNSSRSSSVQEEGLKEIAASNVNTDMLHPESEEKVGSTSVYDERDSNEELLNCFLKEFFS